MSNRLNLYTYTILSIYYTVIQKIFEVNCVRLLIRKNKTFRKTPQRRTCLHSITEIKTKFSLFNRDQNFPHPIFFFTCLMQTQALFYEIIIEAPTILLA